MATYPDRPSGPMYFRESASINPTGVYAHVQDVTIETAPFELPPRKPTVWERTSNHRKRLVAIVTIAGGGSSLLAAVRWPVWMLLACVPLSCMGVQARRTTSTRRTIIVGLLATLVLGALALTYAALDAPTQPRAAPAPRRSPKPPPWTTKSTGRYAVRELAADDENDLWGIANGTTLLEFDGVGLNELGAPTRLGGKIEHLIQCRGHMLVTYGRGRLAELDNSSPEALRRVSYGHPLDDGRLTGRMACGAGSVFVTMPREARVVRIAVPSLRVIATIPVGESVTDVAYAGGVLYVEDATQAAIITVDLTTNVAAHWTVTMAQPDRIVGLSGEGTLLGHEDTACLGYVIDGAHKERGRGWSIDGGIRALAIGNGQGVLLDNSGLLHRFDDDTGEANASPLRVPGASEAASVAVTASGRTVLAMPAKHMLFTIPATTWNRPQVPHRGVDGCLTAGE